MQDRQSTEETTMLIQSVYQLYSLSKKSLSSAWERFGQKDVLYSVSCRHITFTFADLLLWFFGAGRNCRINIDTRGGGTNSNFSFSRGSGVRRWSTSLIVMENAAGLTLSAKPFSATRPKPICEICTASENEKPSSVPCRSMKWTSFTRWRMPKWQRCVHGFWLRPEYPGRAGDQRLCWPAGTGAKHFDPVLCARADRWWDW